MDPDAVPTPMLEVGERDGEPARRRPDHPGPKEIGEVGRRGVADTVRRSISKK